MKRFTQKFLQGKDRDRISDGRENYEEIRFYETETKKLKKIVSLYFFTAITLVLSICIILLSGSISRTALRENSFWGRGAEQVARFFTKGNFLSFYLTADSIGKDEDDFVDKENELVSNTEQTKNNVETELQGSVQIEGDPLPLTKDSLYFFDRSLVPEGETAIIPMDLSLRTYGAHYINNSTGYDPDTAKLIAAELKDTVDIEYLSSNGSPIVLIVHTHATEAYSADGAISYYDDGGEYARSYDINENVVAVGEVLADELNRAGINTLHSKVLHDKEGYKDSYARSEETIRRYLEKYPTIRLVIDLHRDAVVRSDGELVRPVALCDGEAIAQVMCVVGSDFGGQKCPNWERNLSLALKLRELLNSKNEGVCRPPYLKSSTYNQELAPYSLLLEMGASGNSLEEAKRSAKLVASSLIEIIGNL